MAVLQAARTTATGLLGGYRSGPRRWLSGEQRLLDDGAEAKQREHASD
ncbi:MAG: hypothetical protein ABSE52_11810 [Candidatus Dormibacteria bacterium]